MASAAWGQFLVHTFDTHKEDGISIFEDFFDFAYEHVSGFSYVDSLKGDISAFMWPVKKDELIEQVEWTAANGLYFTPLMYSDGRIYKDDQGKTVTGRKKENAKEGCVVFCDADTATPDKFRVKPSAILQSSPGRYQLYWKLDKAYDAPQILEIAKKISLAHLGEGADISSSQGSKLMLVPGSRNMKVNRETGKYVHPTLPLVSIEYTGANYTLVQLNETYKDITVTKETVYDPSGETPELLEFETVANRLGDKSPNGSSYDDLIFGTPWIGDSGTYTGDRTVYRWRLLCELFREGLSDQEVLTVAWASNTTEKWREDPRGMDYFFKKEVLKAKAVALEPDFIAPDPEDVGDHEIQSERVKLLTDIERHKVETDINFISSYQEWAQSRLSKANLPYHRLNAWMVLSGAYGAHGTVPDEHGNVGLNFFGFNIGESGTGKGNAKSMRDEMFDEVLEDGWRRNDSTNIGANASPNALTQALITRDGKVSILSSDEGHGVIKIMKEQAWTTGGLELWTDLYDGEVPIMYRTQNKDVSGKYTTTCFLIWLQGTRSGMAEALTPDMFSSGFLGRFIWAIGDPPLITKESMTPKMRNLTSASKGYDPFARQVGLEVSRRRALIRHRGVGDAPPIEFNQKALDRIGAASWDMFNYVSGRHNAEYLKTPQRRMSLSIIKAAALMALYEGCVEVSLRHALIAIHAAEEWFTNMLTMADSIAMSDWARDTAAIENYIRKEGGLVSEVKLNNAFASVRVDIRARLLEDLKSRARIKESKKGKARAWEIV